MNRIKRALLTAKQFWSFPPRRDASTLLLDNSVILRGIRVPSVDRNPLLTSQGSTSGRHWIKGVQLCSWVSSGVLCVNIILTIIAAILAYARNDAQGFVSAPVYQGKCSVSRRWATGLHFLINILSTAMLTASNYCMQCLASPSRAEVDDAHRRRVWLSIGVPKIADLTLYGKGSRRWLGIVLLFTSLPIHLIYNSATYYALGPSEYGIAIVTENRTLITDRAPSRIADDEICSNRLLNMDISSISTASSENNLQKLSKEDCVDAFAQDYVYGHKILYLMTSTSLPDDQRILYVGRGNYQPEYATKSRSTFQWMCADTNCSKKGLEDKLETWALRGASWSTPMLNLVIPGYIAGENITVHNLTGHTEQPDYDQLYDILIQRRPGKEDLRALLDNSDLWDNSSWANNVDIAGGQTQFCGGPDSEKHYRIESCMTLPAEERCLLAFSPPICLIVILCNMIKISCMLLAARDDRDDPLLTVGDAISSFLTRPDPATKDDALLSMAHVKRGALRWHESYAEICSCDLCDARKQKGLQGQLCRRLNNSSRWMEAAGGSLWLGVLVMSASLLCVAGFLLSLAVADIDNYNSGSSIWDYGLGDVSMATLITGVILPDHGINLIWIILLANTPQLLVSLSYFMYNALLSCMLLAAEYDDYAIERKPLRVSWPSGAQRSTYYLSLPYRYSIPLQIASAFLHWLVSQSLFFVQIIPRGMDGAPWDKGRVITCGYSAQATIYAMILGGVMITAALILGSRRFKSSMPLALYCSAAISAACHPCTDNEHALLPVKWGEIVVKSSPSSSIYSDQERSRYGAARERSSSLGDHGSSDAGEEDRLGGGTNVEPSATRSFHCSFTSGEVVKPDITRDYI